MNWKVILAGLSLLRELIKYLRERKKCDCPDTQAHTMRVITEQIKTARTENADLKIIV